MVFGVAFFSMLGFWQLNRAAEKEAIIAARQDNANTGQQTFSGRYLSERQLLLDNQIFERKAGFHVWTPLQVDGGMLIVNRGWVAGHADRSRLPQWSTPQGDVVVSGVLAEFPRSGWSLSNSCNPEKWPHVVQYPALDELQCLFDRPLRNEILLLAPDHPDGFTREWADLGIPPERHIGYAVQWFALALAALVIFIVTQTSRVTRRGSPE